MLPVQHAMIHRRPVGGDAGVLDNSIQHHEAEQFRHIVNNLEASIKTLGAHRQTKSQYLDTGLKLELDLVISRSEEILHTIDRMINGYGQDNRGKGCRFDKLFGNHTTSTNDKLVLNSCLRNLIAYIERMEAVQVHLDDNKNNGIVSHISIYQDSLAPQTQGLRAPSLRKLRSKQALLRYDGATTLVNKSTLAVVHEMEATVPHYHVNQDTGSSILSSEIRTTSWSSCTGSPSTFSGESSQLSSCTGEYCTHNSCENRCGRKSGGGPGCPDGDDVKDLHKINLDPHYSDKICISSPLLRDDAFDRTSLRAPLRRRKIKSGLI